MSNNKNQRTVAGKPIYVWVILALVLIAYFVYNKFNAPKIEPLQEGTAELHVIDIGQGDSMLFRTEDAIVLIDAGPKSSEDTLKKYLKSYGVEDIDYAVFTHPHEDHIGGAAMIINDFNVKNVIMPDYEWSTKTFDDMIDALEKNGTTVYKAVSGDEYTAGELKMTVLAPNFEHYEECNDYSVVLKVEYGETSFMMTGDASYISEKEILQKFGKDFLDCDFLKSGHHGSSTSSNFDFLKAVSPKFAAISCGEGNDYGHPHKETLQKYEKLGIDVSRTDLSGTIVFVSDGKEITKK